MKSITLNASAMRSGEVDIILAGGIESMSNAPYILPSVRWGQTPEQAAREAMDQCDRNKYVAGLKAKDYEKFRVIGIGFKGKELKMLW